MMLHSGRNVATPVRAASSLFSALDESLLEGAGALLQQLPEELRQQARLDLARRLSPEIQARCFKRVSAIVQTSPRGY